MNIYRSLVPLGKKTAVALGYFDGVHKGHKAVIDKTVELAKKMSLTSAVFTFDFSSQRPSGKGFSDIMDFDLKVRVIEKMGIEEYFAIDFSEIFSLEGKDFVDKILSHGCLNAALVCCGSDFRFGQGRNCGVEQLKKLCGPHGIQVFVVDEVYDKGAVSTTRIKRFIETGKIEAAGRLMGRPYITCGAVAESYPFSEVSNCQVVRSFLPLGFVGPKSGEYQGEARVGDETFGAITFVADIGEIKRFESYIVDFDGDPNSLEISLLRAIKTENAEKTEDERIEFIKSEIDRLRMRSYS